MICLVCGHPRTHHVDPTDDLFAVPSINIHGCHISTALENARIDEAVDWQMSKSPAAQDEQRRRDNAARWNWREA